MPARAGTVSPSDHLPPDRQKIYDNMQELRRPEHLWDEVVTACHRVDKDEEENVMRKLLKHSMVVLVKESDLPRDSRGSFLAGGLFCVAKNDLEDRLVLDRRPQNATMERLVWARLPAGACFARMLLRPWEFVRGSGSDLRNYYFALKLPDNWVRFNAVGRRVSDALVREFGGEQGEAYRACFRVLGMGDRNACDIAQGTHEAILEKVGLLQLESKLVYGEPPPEASVWEGVYLDDLLVTNKVAMEFDIPLDGSFVPPSMKSSDADAKHMRLAEEA